MTAIKEENSEDEEVINDESCAEVNVTRLDNMVSGRSQSFSIEKTDTKLPRNLVTVCDSMGNVLCNPDEYDQHQLTITYQKLTESSYSEVVSRYQCLTRMECFETSTLMDPEVTE
jgi:hypothetical protein